MSNILSSAWEIMVSFPLMNFRILSWTVLNASGVLAFALRSTEAIFPPSPVRAEEGAVATCCPATIPTGNVSYIVSPGSARGVSCCPAGVPNTTSVAAASIPLSCSRFTTSFRRFAFSSRVAACASPHALTSLMAFSILRSDCTFGKFLWNSFRETTTLPLVFSRSGMDLRLSAL